MSNQLTISASGLNLFNNPVAANSTQNSATPVQGAVTSGFGITACTLSISKQGREKAQNQAVDEERRKRQEFWAQRKLLTYEDVPHTMAEPWVYDDPCWKDKLDMMRTDEPETYVEYEELLRLSGDDPSGKAYIEFAGVSSKRTQNRTEEEWEYFSWAHALFNDWFYRRCLDKNGAMCNPNVGRRSICKDLESKNYGVSFDIYSEKYPAGGMTESRFNLNVRLSTGIVNELAKADNTEGLSAKDAEQIKKWTDRIDQSVTEIKNAAEQYYSEMKAFSKQYGGVAKSRSFGVRLGEDGTTTYYTDYLTEYYRTGEDGGRVTAGSVNELLEKLREKEIPIMQEEKVKMDEIMASIGQKRILQNNVDYHLDASKAVDLEKYME